MKKVFEKKQTIISITVILLAIIISAFYYYNNKTQSEINMADVENVSEKKDVPYYESKEAVLKYVEKYWEEKNLIYSRDADEYIEYMKDKVNTLHERELITEDYYNSIMDRVENTKKEDLLSLMDYEISYSGKSKRNNRLEPNKFFKKDEKLSFVKRGNRITVWVDYIDGFRISESIDFIIR
jgi:uncharacterized membrane protein YgaE (UPF0421/DUF939 family)